MPKPAAVEGFVTNALTGAPIKKAIVTLRAPGGRWGYQTLSDPAGHYQFDNIEPGHYALWAEAQGFVVQAPDISRTPAPLQSILLSDGQTVKDRTIQLVPLGAISGKVVDENGEPIPGARVDLMRYSYSRYGKRLEGKARTTSDDRGDYRLHDVAPGRWYLAVSKSISPPQAAGRVHGAGPEREYSRSFYPGGVQESDAAALDVPPGVDLTRKDIQIRKTRVYHIRGKIVDAVSRQPVAQAQVHVDAWYVESRSDGTFDMGGMAPGSYSVSGDVGRENRLVSGILPVIVADRDVEGLFITLAPPFAMRGVVVTEGDAPAKLDLDTVILEPVDETLGNVGARIGADGSFLLSKLISRAYRVRVDSADTGLYLKRARFGDQDITDHSRIDVSPGSGPLELVLAGDTATVDGTIESPGSGQAPISVMLASEDKPERFDLLQTIEPEAPGGSFHFAHVAPGTYKVFAWELLDEQLAEYPEFRKLVESKAATVTVRAGAHETVNVKPIAAGEIEEARRRLR